MIHQRRKLAASDEILKGLYAGNPNRATDQLTAERLLKAFDNITLYQHETATDIKSPNSCHSNVAACN